MPDMSQELKTFLFTDIEASTKLWDKYPLAMQVVLARHDTLLDKIIKQNNGLVFKTIGDAFCAVFDDPLDAVNAVLASQQALANYKVSEEAGNLKVRMALNSGCCQTRDGDFFGPVLNHLSRILSTVHGGQVILSKPTRDLIWGNLPDGAALQDLGEHRLKDLNTPEHLFQLVSPFLQSSFPPLKSLSTHPHNLPSQTTPMIGRHEQILKAVNFLHQPDIRLLTLTGPGGTGKTRLSLKVAEEILHKFEDGIFFVPLAGLSDPIEFIPALAHSLEVKEKEGQPLFAALKEFLQQKRMLLVLDNFEQIVEAAPRIGELIANSSFLKVIVTTRTVLRIYGEQEFQVPPLSLPDLAELSSFQPPSLEEIKQYPAVELFIQRSKLVKPNFELTNENFRAVSEICTRLDGLPLAIELAAARIKMLKPDSLLERLSSRLKLLTNGSHDHTSRQQTLRGAIEWGYNLLNEDEKKLFARLAVFPASCTFEAVEDICNFDQNQPIDVLEGLSSLVDKSLLQQKETEQGDFRFEMLETIREYSLEKLEESGEADTAYSRHGSYFLNLAQEAETGLTGVDQVMWIQKLEWEHSNFRLVITRALSPGINNKEEVLRLGAALWRFWSIRGYLSEGRRWLEKGLELINSETEGKEFQNGAQMENKLLLMAKAYNAVGILARDQGDYKGALSLMEKALELQRQIGDRSGIANALNTLGTIAANIGQYKQAEAFHREALSLRKELAERRGEAVSLCNLGAIYLSQGNFNKTKIYYNEALSLLRQLGDKRNMARLLNNLGHIFLTRGKPSLALKHIQESLAIRRELGEKAGVGVCLLDLGHVSIALGEPEKAAGLYWEALVILQNVGDNLNIPFCLEGLANTICITGEAEKAAQLYGKAEALRLETGAPLQPTDREQHIRKVEAVRAQLKPGVFDIEFEKGRNLSFDQIVSLALKEKHPALL